MDYPRRSANKLKGEQPGLQNSTELAEVSRGHSTYKKKEILLYGRTEHVK